MKVAYSKRPAIVIKRAKEEVLFALKFLHQKWTTLRSDTRIYEGAMIADKI